MRRVSVRLPLSYPHLPPLPVLTQRSLQFGLCLALLLPALGQLLGGQSPVSNFEKGSENYGHALEAVRLLNQASSRVHVLGLKEVVSMTSQVVAGVKYTIEAKLAETSCLVAEMPAMTLSDLDRCEISQAADVHTWHLEAVNAPWLTPKWTLISSVDTSV